jgi:hypothetical protein
MFSTEFWNEFPRWYIAIFEVSYGASTIVRAGWIDDPKRRFRREIEDPQLGARFRSVLERRRAIEAIPQTPWRINGAVSVTLGILTALGIVSPVVSYALVCLSMGVVMTTIYVRLRNRGERRAASLAPRTAAQIVPWWLYALAAIGALTPLPFMTNPTLVVPAAIVALVSTMMIVAASMVSGMSAMLTGDDSEIELVVEDRVRSYRVGSLLFVAIALPFVFFAMGSIASAEPGPGTQLQAVAGTINAATFLGVLGWWTLCLLRKAKPADRVHVL